MFWVYILRCADGSYYTGHTDNLESRMNQYHAGECNGYVAARLPAEMIWSQECATRHEALSAEQQIKGWSRKKKEAMMQGNWEEVSRLAKNKISDLPEPAEVSPHSGGAPTGVLLASVVGRQNPKTVRAEPGGTTSQPAKPSKNFSQAVGYIEARDANNKSAHPSTSSGRTDLCARVKRMA